ncbi:MAG: MFS transporter [Clostridia bacterium]|nr:MFS transporter [Clostridia bacterium]
MDNKVFGKRNWRILLVFGLIGQIAWAVENMYFNLFVFETIAPDLNTVTLMVQLSGVAATLTTLVAGTVSDKVGNRRAFISWGYIIWGVTVALFGMLSTEGVATAFSWDAARALGVTLALAVVCDCVMTVFGSTANDAAFNAWVTDNTAESYRGKVEGVLAILPLAAMLVVAGGFGMLVELIGYRGLFLALGVVISACGIFGLFFVTDSKDLAKSGSLSDILYGFKPRVVRENPALYLTFAIMCVYGIACQVFMPYLIIYMKTYLGFSTLEYSVLFGFAIIAGALINLKLGALSDRLNKAKLLYIAAGLLAVGLAAMYFARFGSKLTVLLTFGVAGFVMITGYIYVSALCGALSRDHTPQGDVGKLQGVRMVFGVLIPMLIGPMIGNAINKQAGVTLPDLGSADTMTTAYIPAPGIFLVGALVALLIFALVPLLCKCLKNAKGSEE